ncbi:hypothetical protein NPS01_42740 [Nocardioides psychrotolerans]|uniref:Uncharacterized protein n=1 Tax=Nocardioides psychrotolerans TaxID=1005945 RepID=A0A1I3MAD5_9ACTN|nr:hypothetical protein [Nocardioides psychrotolerans]GEP40611.1 hypothetical protein NPS01_42740 [Nocardioides psychrotolerans]SFI93999.1 hypothetical protein SAMN05216561_11530 [Nocardioides psychrotolerans]
MAAARKQRWHVYDATIDHVVSPEFDDEAGAKTFAKLIAGSHDLVIKRIDADPPAPPD